MHFNFFMRRRDHREAERREQARIRAAQAVQQQDLSYELYLRLAAVATGHLNRHRLIVAKPTEHQGASRVTVHLNRSRGLPLDPVLIFQAEVDVPHDHLQALRADGTFYCLRISCFGDFAERCESHLKGYCYCPEEPEPVA